MAIVGVCGNGYSGSGAVLDLLREYDNCIDVCGEKEFIFPYVPDGVNDLYYHLSVCPARFQSSDVAIKRFHDTINRLIDSEWNTGVSNKMKCVTEKFLDNIVQVEWNGYWAIDVLEQQENIVKYVLFRLRRKLYSLTNQRFPMIKERKMNLSIHPEKFMQFAKAYLMELLAAQREIDCYEKNLVLNQPFPANNPEPFMKYFDNAKCIIVYRDPRDTYLLLKNVQNYNSRWFPHDNVDSFITYYQLLHDSLQQLKENKDILVIRFENLIYNYNSSVLEIEKFIGNLGNHIMPKKYFLPDVSKNNTQLYKHYTGYNDDIMSIEKNLSSFLYDFSDKECVYNKSIF